MKVNSMMFNEITQEIKINEKETSIKFPYKQIFILLFISMSFICYLILTHNNTRLQIKKIPKTYDNRESFFKNNIYDSIFMQYLNKGNLTKIKGVINYTSQNIQNKYKNKLIYNEKCFEKINLKFKASCKDYIDSYLCLLKIKNIFNDLNIYNLDIKIKKKITHLEKYCNYNIKFKEKNKIEPLDKIKKSNIEKEAMDKFIKGYSLIDKDLNLGIKYLKKSKSLLEKSNKYLKIIDKILLNLTERK